MKLSPKTWAGLAIILVVVALAVVTTQRAGGHKGWHSWRRCACPLARWSSPLQEDRQRLWHHLARVVQWGVERLLFLAYNHAGTGFQAVSLNSRALQECSSRTEHDKRR